MKNTVLELAFTGGIDEAQRAELVDPRAAFITLENVRQNKRGGATKRYGFSALALLRNGSDARSTGRRLIARDDAILTSDGTYIDAYSMSMGKASVVGSAPVCSVTSDWLTSYGTFTLTQDVAYANGYVAVSWLSLTSGSAYAVSVGIFDEKTKLLLGGLGVPATLSSTGTIRGGYLAVISSRYLVAVYGTTGSNTLTAYYCDTQSGSLPAWTAIGSVATDWSGAQDTLAIHGFGDRVAVAYANNSGGTNRLSLKTFNTSGVVESTTINTSSTSPSGIEVCGSSSDRLWLLWGQGTDVHCQGHTYNSISTITATDMVVASVATAVWGVFAVHDSSTAGAGRLIVGDTTETCVMNSWTTAAGAVVAGSSVTLRNARPLGRPFEETNIHRFFVPLCTGNDPTGGGYNEDNTEANHLLCEMSVDSTTQAPFANVHPSLIRSGTEKGGVGINTPPKRKIVQSSTSTKWYGATGVLRSSVGVASALLSYDFASTQACAPATHGGSLFLSGGLLMACDGHAVFEAGFVARPTKPTTSTSGTGITAVTGWKYVAIYEYADADGNWTVSGISDPSASTGAVANKTVTVATRPLTVTHRSNSRIAFYRTTDGGSPPYYFLAHVTNDPTAATNTYADTTSDATLAAHAKLYSPSLPGVNGSAQDRRAPPGLLHLVSYNGMLVGSTGQDLWYSGQDVSGEATWFNPLFQLPVTGLGDITGLAVQDGTLFVFSRRGVWAVSGEAPSDNGASGGLGTPRRLAVDVGCIDARSIVVTALGVFFQSERGIELLTRAQSVEWVGEPVQDTVASYPVCTAATLDPAASLVLFEMAAGETANQVTGSGRTLVFDVSLKLWTSVDRRKNNAGTADTPAQSGAMIYTGSAWRYAWLGTDGRVYVEDQTTHLDPGSAWVTMKAGTSWAHTAGMQGEQAIEAMLLLAERHTGHDLAASIYHEYVDSSPETQTFTAASIAALGRQWLERKLTTQKGSAIRVVLSDATPSSGTVGTGKGATWVGLTFTGEPRPGAKRVSSGQRGA